MLDVGAITAFRVRGRYYSVFESDPVKSVPSCLGKQFMSEIPSDPAAFEEWKSAKIRHYRAEEVRLNNLRKAGLSSPNYGDFWGYPFEPSYQQPSPRGRGWTYIIDLDADTFTITRTFMKNRTFPINNIPESMFACISDPMQLMVTPVPQRMLNSPNFDSELVTLYQRSEPQVASISHMAGTVNISRRVMLRQRLIQRFVSHYYTLFELIRDDCQTNIFYFRLLMYGVLNICNDSADLCFEPEMFPASYKAVINRDHRAFVTPCWEIPTSSDYTLNSVIIILEPSIHILEYLQAAIGKAISMANTRPNSRSALIVSLNSVVVAQFTRTNNILTVSHTENLLFCPSHVFASYGRDSSVGIDAVIETFASQFRSLCTIPTPFPAELWDVIFLHCAPSTKFAFGETCRFFHSISHRSPRLGSWMLERMWRDVFGKRSESGLKHDIALEEELDQNAVSLKEYKAVLYVSGERMELGLPLFGGKYGYWG